MGGGLPIGMFSPRNKEGYDYDNNYDNNNYDKDSTTKLINSPVISSVRINPPPSFVVVIVVLFKRRG